ncbi:GNAT family N-acetyltransferase [Rhodococcus antarcticus]|uniref:GNAT family N-acetyltransferase n=1 Tax=Rhodococcus antarcticus TaxID=2987751 RepID=UPI00338E0CC3
MYRRYHPRYHSWLAFRAHTSSLQDVTGVGSIRAAVPHDAPALGDVHVACWREAYVHLLSPAFLAAQDVHQRRRHWAQRLAAPGPGLALVAVVDDQIVGSASAAPSRDKPPVREVELVGLYLLAAHQGTGLGQALLYAALGDQPASLWMAQHNLRARAFYARNGFTPDGAHKVEPSREHLDGYLPAPHGDRPRARSSPARGLGLLSGEVDRIAVGVGPNPHTDGGPTRVRDWGLCRHLQRLQMWSVTVDFHRSSAAIRLQADHVTVGRPRRCPTGLRPTGLKERRCGPSPNVVSCRASPTGS